MSLNEKMNRLTELRESALAEAKSTEFSTLDADQKEAWAKRNSEMETLAKEIKEQQVYEKQVKDLEEQQEAEAKVTSLPIHEEKAEAPKSFDEELIDSEAYKQYVAKGQMNINSELK